MDVINGTNTYHNPNAQFHNLIAVKTLLGNKIRIECIAKYFMEPISHFGFCTKTEIDKITAKIISDSAEFTSTQTNAKFQNGYTTNIFFRAVSRPTTPGFPVIVEFSHKEGSPFDIDIVLHEKSQGFYEPIPMELK